MYEKRLSKRLKQGAFLMLLFAVLIFLVGILLLVFSRDSIQKAGYQQIRLETEEYKNKVNWQLERDFQALRTMAALLALDGLSDMQGMAERLHLANAQNNFVTMAYFAQDGQGCIAVFGHENGEHIMLDEVSPLSQSVIRRSLEGEDVTSAMFDIMYSNERVFMYSVPVYQEGEVAGALAASSHVRMFEDILEGKAAFGGDGYIHLIDGNGKFLVQSPNVVVKEDMETIFDGPYIPEDAREPVEAALQNQEVFVSTFRYEGKDCYFCLYPTGTNGWYLFCVNRPESIFTYQTANMLILMFGCVMLLVLVFLLYSNGLIRKNNQELQYFAHHDVLTGAHNFEYFDQRLTELRTQDMNGCVVAINIRQFKFINEIFGKQYGNDLLCSIRIMLEKRLSEGEFFCRDSADLFYVFLKDTEKTVILERVKELLEAISQWSLNGHSNYRILAYAGAVVVEKGSDFAEQKSMDLLTPTLFALDKAREIPANSLWFYDTELHKKEELENFVESHMYQALKDGAFQLYLQPKMDLKTQDLAGAEALVRWITDEGKMLFPNQFIPLFEKNGFCVQLDMYMLDCACRQIKKWTEMGIHPIPISVNQSKLLFFEENYIHDLSEIIRKYEIPAGLITLEILEGLALENADALNEKIKQIQALGVQISMDDFGSGYSSLNTLNDLDINELKLDRGFLLKAAGSDAERTHIILEQIVDLAKRLNIRTVAEGVETAEDEQRMQRLGCDYGQGYYYSKPICVRAFEEKYLQGKQAL